MKILVVRNDKLGDFMLAWPVFALIKRYLPDAHITVLVPNYTAPMAHLCPAIDDVLIDDKAQGAFALSRQMRQGNFDCLLTLFSTSHVAIAGWLAGIRYRLAPATKIAQLFYNHRLTQRRSQSAKPEYAYNLDLAMQLLMDLKMITHGATEEQSGDWLPVEVERPLLRFNDDRDVMKQTFCAEHNLVHSHQMVFIHPGSGGSANNLRPEQYAELANLLSEDKPLAFVISAGPGEREIAEQVANGITAPVTIYDSSAGLAEFARTLQLADLFISGSTGPLHIAGALDRPTAAFYPAHRSATPLRWQTLNSPLRRLAFSPLAGDTEREVATIDINSAAQCISKHLLND